MVNIHGRFYERGCEINEMVIGFIPEISLLPQQIEGVTLS